MIIRVYQIDSDKDEKRIKFCGYIETMHFAGAIDGSIYDCVFDGELPSGSLENVYRDLNLTAPEGFRGHSLCVSDVIEIVNPMDAKGADGRNIEKGFYFCNSFGFVRLADEVAATFQPQTTNEWRHGNLSIDGELEVEKNDAEELEVTAEFHTWFDVDRKFHLNTAARDDAWVNLYAIYNVPHDSFRVVYILSTDDAEEAHNYKPTTRELAIIRSLMADAARKDLENPLRAFAEEVNIRN